MPYPVSSIRNKANGSIQSSITFQTSTSGFFEILFTFSVGGGPMLVDFGDGSLCSSVSGCSRTYPDSTTKTVTLSCPDWGKVTSFTCNYMSTTQPIPDFSSLTNLTTLQLFGRFTTIPVSLSQLTKLTSLRIRTDNPFGYPVYSAGVLAGMKSLSVLNLSGGYLNETAFDQIFSDLISSLGGGRVTCNLTVSPIFYQSWATGLLPSVTVMSQASTLRTAGWTVNNIASPGLGIIGDSIDAGTLTFFDGSAWVQSVKSAYNNGDCSYRNVAFASQGIVAGSIANMLTQTSRLNGCSLVLIKLGTNDDNSGNMNTLRTTYESGIDTLISNNPSATIVAINILPRWTNNTTGPEVDKSNIRTAIAAACSNKGITCLDSYSTPWILQSDTIDGLHPTAGGHTKIANAVKTALGI